MRFGVWYGVLGSDMVSRLGMKRIDVKEQARLGAGRTFSLTVIGIRYRMFRSSVTVAVVIVAIAFLMNVLSESLIKRSIVIKTGDRIAEIRQSALWAARLSNPGTLEEIVLSIASAGETDPAYGEAHTIGRLSAEEVSAFRARCQKAASCLEFFDGLEYGRKRRLVGNALGCEIFRRLSRPEEFERFESELSAMKSIRFVSNIQAFREFLAQWPPLEQELARMRELRSEAVDQVSRQLGGRSYMEALRNADGDFGEAVRAAGFALSASTAEVVARQAHQTLRMRSLEESVLSPGMRQAVAGYMDMTPTEVNVQVLWEMLRDRDMASWYLSKLQEEQFDVGDVTAEQLTELARIESESKALRFHAGLCRRHRQRHADVGHRAFPRDRHAEMPRRVGHFYHADVRHRGGHAGRCWRNRRRGCRRHHRVCAPANRLRPCGKRRHSLWSTAGSDGHGGGSRHRSRGHRGALSLVQSGAVGAHGSNAG